MKPIKLFLALFLFASPFSSHAQDMKIWVFIVGISDYEYFNDLNYADDDALAFETLLKKTLGSYYNKDQTRIILNKDATSASIESGMRWLLRNVKENDKVYFYFSGHGGFEDLTDFKLGYLHAFDAYNQTYSSGGNISLEFLQAFLQSLSARNVQTYFVADACHAGKSDGGTGGFMFLNNSLAKETQNIYKILSAQGNEKSYENTRWGGGHGVFTYYVIKGLMGFADKAPEDGLITLFELERFLMENVPTQTQYLQNPKVVASRKDMYLAKVNQAEFEVYKELMSNEEEVNLIESLSKGSDNYIINQLSDSIKHVYNLFNKAIERNNLVTPEDSNAFKYYKYIASHEDNDRLDEIMYEKLYISIMNQSQRYLNLRLELLEKRVEYKMEDIIPLDQALRELIKITEVSDPLYNKIKVRQYYIEGELNHWKFDRDQIKKKEYKAILPNLLAAIEIDPTAAYLYYNIGALYYHTKEYDKGIKYSLRAMDLAPKWSGPYNNLGNIYDSKKQKDSAIYYFKKAIVHSPNYGAAYWNLAWQYEYTKPDHIKYKERLDSAAILYLKSNEYTKNKDDRSINTVYAASIYGKLYDITKDREYLIKAMHLMETILAIPYENYWILDDLAELQVEYDEESPKSFITRARYYAAKEKYNKAVKQLSIAYDYDYEDWTEFELYPEVKDFIESDEYQTFLGDIGY